MLTLDEDLRSRLPPFFAQEAELDPVVFLRFHLPGTEWAWYAIEGEAEGDDFRFYGFIAGAANSFGSFTLSQLRRQYSPDGAGVELDAMFQPGRLTSVVPAPDL